MSMPDPPTPPDLLRCDHRHDRSADVRLRRVYVGGVGYTWVANCRDLTACWARWKDQQRATATVAAS